MRLIDPILMEFDRECGTTKKLLERVPGDKLDWTPHPTSMPLGSLAFHVATIPQFFGSTLIAGGVNLDEVAFPKAPDSVEKILEAFQAAVVTAKGAMAQLDDALAMGEWTFTMKGKTIFSVPRIGLVRSILMNHTIHHRGQLSVYLRMLDVKIPSIYGPSGDDNPFA